MEREYSKTHCWITFLADFSKADWQLWMKLGAIQSKCKHIANVMLTPEVSHQLLVLNLAKGVQATAAIEGNTLTEDEVLARVQGDKRKFPESKEYLGVEVDNVIEACNRIQQRVITGNDSECRLTVEKICEYNRILLNKLDCEEHVVPGKIRQLSVGVGSYRGAPHEDCEYLLERMCRWINDEIQPPKEEDRIAFGVIRAILAHLYLAWIHPFGDGNGRTARLIELQILLSVGVPNVAAHLLSNHYNLTRPKYYRELDRASKSNGNIIPFLMYAAQGLFDGLNETIEKIQGFQVSVMWRDYVYSKFRDNQSSQASERKRQLALALWDYRDGVLINRIPTLTTNLALSYSGKTLRTVTRDIHDLVEMDLVKKHGARKIMPNLSPLLAFFPDSRSLSTSPTE